MCDGAILEFERVRVAATVTPVEAFDECGLHIGADHANGSSSIKEVALLHLCQTITVVGCFPARVHALGLGVERTVELRIKEAPPSRICSGRLLIQKNTFTCISTPRMTRSMHT